MLSTFDELLGSSSSYGRCQCVIFVNNHIRPRSSSRDLLGNLMIMTVDSSCDVDTNGARGSDTPLGISADWCTRLAIECKLFLMVRIFCVKKLLNCCAGFLDVPSIGRKGAHLSPGDSLLSDKYL